MTNPYVPGPEPREVDLMLEVLRRHRVAVYKSEAFSVEFDTSAFEPTPAIGDDTPSPGADEARKEAAKREWDETMYRSAR